MALYGDGEDSPAVHGTDRVFAKIPEYLFDLVAIRNDHCVAHGESAFDPDSGFLRRHAVIHKRESIFHELHQVNLIEAVALGAGVGQKIGDDAVQPLRFASDNAEQTPMLFVQFRNEEHRRLDRKSTSELQSPDHLVCRLLLEKKKNTSSLISTPPP